MHRPYRRESNRLVLLAGAAFLIGMLLDSFALAATTVARDLQMTSWDMLMEIGPLPLLSMIVVTALVIGACIRALIDRRWRACWRVRDVAVFGALVLVAMASSTAPLWLGLT
ncbi:hypothetical protein CKO28_02950 [Rhodovibrio sodomensis]|uniref:DUF5658 domain-containing protein n=1 Tax=Rhodovibrio sodomensis TaxID=1088 RepID=A0ABS1DAM5_9PROT|nr:hypothetical protein [Rhodovibrio sodomensis]MBK1667001.1 hypothetical protein [Rhodovibrio sodomensis]